MVNWRRYIAAKLIVLIIVSRPGLVGATLVDTDTGRFVLTPSGVTKVESAMTKVGKGLRILEALGRIAGPVALGFALFEIGSQVWDWWHRDYTVTDLPSSTTNGGWGVPYGTSGTYEVLQTEYKKNCQGWADGWFAYGNYYGSNPPTVGAGNNIVGVQVENYSNGTCTRVVYRYLAWTGSAMPVSNAKSTGAQTRESVIQQIDGAVAELSAKGATGMTVNNQTVYYPNGAGAMQRSIDDLLAARSVLSEGVQLSPGTDVTQGANYGQAQGTAPAPVPIGTTPSGGSSASPDMTATNTKLGEIKDVLTDMKNTPGSSAPGVTCDTCTRTESWGSLMQSWQGLATSAPIFALIARLAWPGSGTVQRQWTVGTWSGNTLTVDLDNAGIGTAITAVRFVVVGGAVIVAYMILFG